MGAEEGSADGGGRGRRCDRAQVAGLLTNQYGRNERPLLRPARHAVELLRRWLARAVSRGGVRNGEGLHQRLRPVGERGPRHGGPRRPGGSSLRGVYRDGRRHRRPASAVAGPRLRRALAALGGVLALGVSHPLRFSRRPRGVPRGVTAVGVRRVTPGGKKCERKVVYPPFGQTFPKNVVPDCVAEAG